MSVEPRNIFETTTVNGNLVAGANSTLRITVYPGGPGGPGLPGLPPPGPTPPSSDELIVVGTANLGGSVRVSLGTRAAGVYVPNNGDTFTILEVQGPSAKINGKFNGTVLGDALPKGWHWELDYSNPKEVILRAVLAQATAISEPAGTPFTNAVATLTGIGISDEASIYAAISWGDQTTGSTQYSQSNSGITFTTDANGVITAIVNGTHDFQTVGNFAVRTTFFCCGQELGIVDSKATVTFPAFSVNIPTGLQFVKGVNNNWNQVVATFDAPEASLWQLSASIDWGDGQVMPGEVEYYSGGQYQVWAGLLHSYASAGQKQITVTVTAPDDSTASATQPVTVLPQRLLGWGQYSAMPEGSTFSGLVGTFIDPAGTEDPSHYSVVVSASSSSRPLELPDAADGPARLRS